MLTIREARRLQRKKANSILLRFTVSVIVFGTASLLAALYTNILEYGTVFWFFPVTAFLLTVLATKIYKLLAPAEFCGRVISLYVRNIDNHRSKVVGGGRTVCVFEDLPHKKLEADVIIENERGKSISRPLRNQDVIPKLSEGDSVIYFRLIGELIITEENKQ